MEKKQSVYSKIALDLLNKIKSDVYPIGSKLPPERVLMQIYGVERTTVRRGLELLRKDGYINKAAGLGSIVTSKVPVMLSMDTDSCSICAVPSENNAVNVSHQSSILMLFPDDAKCIEEKNLSVCSAVIENLEKLCKEKGAKLTSACTHDTEEIMDICKKNSIDSCVIFFSARDSIISLLEKYGISLCFAFNRETGYKCIIPDIQSSCELAAEKLTSLGHTSIAFIGSEENSFCQREMRIRFTNAVLNRAPDSDIGQFTNTGGQSEKSGFDRLSELIRRAGGNFTAVATINDDVARGAIKAAKYYKISVPEELSIISLSSVDAKESFDRVYTNPGYIAQEIFNACRFPRDNSFGSVTSPCCELVDSKTTLPVKIEKKDSRRLSDFLL